MKKKILIFSSIIALVLCAALMVTVFAATESATPKLSFYARNLSFNDSVYIIFYVKAENANPSDVKLLTWTAEQTDYSAASAEKKLNYAYEETINGQKYLRFEYRSLAAKNMTDTIYARAYVSVDGSEYYSDVTSYSVLQYAYNKLGKTGTATSNENLKALLTQMLDYGAAAQKYFGYNTDKLATDPFWQVTVSGGKLSTGFTTGLFREGTSVTIIADDTISDTDFYGWKNSAGTVVGTSRTLTVTAKTKNETYTAIYCSSDKSTHSKTVVAPTEIKDGYTIYTCDVCGESYRADYIPARGTDELTYTVNSDGITCTVTGMTGTDTEILIPEYIDGYKVTTIGSAAFKQNKTLRIVHLPDTVTTITSMAFSECAALYEIQLPPRLVTIGSWAFNNCNITTDFIIPKTLTSIGTSAFVSCGTLSDVYYEGTEDEWNAISIASGNTALTSVNRHYRFGYDDIPENYIIEKASGTVTVDAVKDSSYTTKVYIDHKLVTKEGYESVGEGKSVAWLTASNYGMYVYAEIEDSTMTTTSGDDGDMFNIFVDYINSHEESGLTGSEYRSAMGTAGSKKLGRICIKPNGDCTASWGFSNVTAIKSSFKTITGGYAVEIYLPFPSLKNGGRNVGIGFEVKDDTDGDGSRDSAYYNTAIGTCYYVRYDCLPRYTLSQNYVAPAEKIDYTKVSIGLDGYKDAAYRTKVDINTPWDSNPANSVGNGTAWLSQDNKGLYVFIDVIDHNVYNNTDGSVTDGDRIQVYLDYKNDHATSGLSGTDYRNTYTSTGHLGYITVSPDGEIIGNYNFSDLNGVKRISRRTDSGYAIELYIPFTASMSDTIGIGFEIHNDTNGVLDSDGKHNREAIFVDTADGLNYWQDYDLLPDYSIEEAPILTSFCFTDIHNNFTMLEPTNTTGDYIIRKTATLAIDEILATEGKVDVAIIGGDYMSDYPSWDSSGKLPYSYFLGYKAKTLETFGKLAEGEKVIFVAGNHDYAQGEQSGLGGPGTGGSYNSFDFYSGDGMKKTMGELAAEDKFEKVGTHTGETYLLAYYYEVNGIGFAGLSPDPDIIWSAQGDGMSDEALAWLDAKLDAEDPDGTKVIFLNCHYVIDSRGPSSLNGNSTYHTEKLTPVFLGHNNLFHLYGHWETWFSTNTVNNVFHYDKNGNLVGIARNETNSDQVLPAESRGFNAVYMGHFRPMQGSYPDWFYDDPVKGYGGYSTQRAPLSTATPKIAQGMYIEVYEDRIVFTMKSFGVLPGFETGTELVPYTVYLNK